MKTRCGGECWTGARAARLAVGGAALLTLALWGGCPRSATPPPETSPGVFNNTTDPTNGNASYIGSAACMACHDLVTPDIVAAFRLHGHPHILTRARGEPLTFPAEADRAGVPNPPAGHPWTDIAYVIGGYISAARFVDQSGFVLTDAGEHAPTQWNLAFPPNGTQPSFGASDPQEPTPLPYNYDCFRCHATGAQPPSTANPVFQDGRPGMAGSFVEPGVQCEACHGPGSNHAPDPAARTEYVPLAAADCGKCHARGPDPTVIAATSDGFIAHDQQYSELLASGGHKSFACTVCHDPHTSVAYANGLRNRCTVCHTDKTLNFHEGKIFVRGDYTEELACESCHMPFATKTGSVATSAIVGNVARVADTRTHIFRITTVNGDYKTMLTADGTRVALDADGKAAVTLDFICLRCHNDVGNAFGLTLKSAAAIAPNAHRVIP